MIHYAPTAQKKARENNPKGERKMNAKTQHYEGHAARMSGSKTVIAMTDLKMLELEYRGTPMWAYQMNPGAVRNVRIYYRLNAKGDKWLIQSLEVVEG